MFTRLTRTMLRQRQTNFSHLYHSNQRYLSKLDQPLPVREEFVKPSPLNTKELEAIPCDLGKHRIPSGASDWLAWKLVRLLRFFADGFFKEKYVHRGIMLETVAGVPGIVAGMTRHLSSLRKFRTDHGWIHKLLHEAENERMHLMTWMQLTTPSPFERFIVIGTQALFFTCYLSMYLVAPKACHRFVGYLEEEAVVSYTHFLEQIDAGKIENTPAPQLAREYWNLGPDATLRDVVLAVRADEASHRDTNHEMADRIWEHQEDLNTKLNSCLLYTSPSPRDS
eukprot:TRINITY_DN8836_c0_g1_i4.p1 TRINITY_DN8836_c0_g1~~TRINITY_DN8836_c0_g1_i4.p1  ORF type:complete len:281 (+),score=48.10 TRINITY_DN8836_c0_g1_i4:52-894(+)